MSESIMKTQAEIYQYVGDENCVFLAIRKGHNQQQLPSALRDDRPPTASKKCTFYQKIWL
jgi:hypothetical protein